MPHFVQMANDFDMPFGDLEVLLVSLFVVGAVNVSRARKMDMTKVSVDGRSRNSQRHL